MICNENCGELYKTFSKMDLVEKTYISCNILSLIDVLQLAKCQIIALCRMIEKSWKC